MKHLLSPFAARVTAWMYDDFHRTRIRLTILYVLIIGVIISLLTFVIVLEVRSQEAHTGPKVFVGRKALDEPTLMRLAGDRFGLSGHRPERYSYKITNGDFVYNAEFDGKGSADVNLFTGATRVYPHNSFSLNSLFDELPEVIIWIGIGLFLLMSSLAYILTKITLWPIQKKMDEQERFVADAAHELRNPLAAVAASLQSLLISPPSTNEEWQSTIKEALSEHERLIATSEHILALAASGTEVVEVKHCHPNQVISRVCDRLRSFAKERNITFLSHLDRETCAVPERDFEHIAFNLIHNAVKFSKENGSVVIIWTPERTLVVEDRGIGIAPEDQEHIFDRFFKVEKARTFSDMQGSGIGLSLVQALVRKYHATVHLTSVLGEGTRFTIRFIE